MDTRYRTPAMDAIWHPRHRNDLERQLWVAVMRAQQEAGVPIPDQAIEDYESAARDIPGFGDIELKEIARMEAETRHDLYARLQYFNTVAGHQDAHQGLTSADIVENATQMQIRQSAEVLAEHADQLAVRLTRLAQDHIRDTLVARTHGRPAQLTTIGKRCTDWLTELAQAANELLINAEQYPQRGVQGAVGTRLDLAALLDRHRAADASHNALELADQVDTAMMYAAGASSQLTSCGQTYPRSLDLPILSAVLQLTATCNTICTNIRLWAVLGHANEQRLVGQVGSSAMPHKTNPRYSERVHSLCVVARGYASMLQELAGGQWFEGDVSTSAARRVALPGLFHTADAILANTAHALDRLRFDEDALEQDVRQHLPHLASGLILDACVAAGVDRATAHEAISSLAQAAQRAQCHPRVWLEAIAAHVDLPLAQEQLDALVTVGRLVEPAVWLTERILEDIDVHTAEEDPEWPGELI